MRKLFIIFFCTIFLCSCGVTDDDTEISSSDTDLLQKNGQKNYDSIEYRKISADEAWDIMVGTEDYILLDVRTNEEYKEKRIDGAILIPDFEISNRAESELPDKDALILIYCRSGRRSENAAKELIDMGYINIYDFGGILDWSYETISD